MLMRQQILATAADLTFEDCRKPTRRDEFLKTKEAMIPRVALYDIDSLRGCLGIDRR